jgi:hypothetical protein
MEVHPSMDKCRAIVNNFGILAKHILKFRNTAWCGDTRLVIPATRRWRQKDLKFEANLSIVSETLSQKQNINKRARVWLKG